MWCLAHVGSYTERVRCWAVTQQRDKITVRHFNLVGLRQSQNSMSLYHIILECILSLVLKDEPVLVPSYKLHIHTLQVSKAWKIVVAFPVEVISWYWTALSRWLKVHLLRWPVIYQLQYCSCVWSKHVSHSIYISHSIGTFVPVRWICTLFLVLILHTRHSIGLTYVTSRSSGVWDSSYMQAFNCVADRTGICEVVIPKLLQYRTIVRSCMSLQ